MQLPKYKKKHPKKLKICKECNKEYWGHPISKYCDVHQDPHNRKRKRQPNAWKPSPSVENQIFDHSFITSTDVEFTCALSGCTNKFTVKLLPRLNIYPKFCTTHRQEFRRKLFERTKAKTKILA